MVKPCVSQQTANLLNALLRTYIGVGCADLSGRCLFGVVRIHTGISREIECTNGGRAGSVRRAAQHSSWLGSQRGSV